MKDLMRKKGLTSLFIDRVKNLDKCKNCEAFLGISDFGEGVKWMQCQGRIKVCKNAIPKKNISNLEKEERIKKRQEEINLLKITRKDRRRIAIDYDISFEDYINITKQCAICGFKEIVHLHHIIPKKKGGKDELSNYVGLCPNHHMMIHQRRKTLEDLKNEN